MTLLYNILFEVKVLHEYYLTDPDNTSVFQDAQQVDRLAWLDKRYKSDQPAGSDDLRFVLPSCLSNAFRNQDIRLLPSLSGFQVAVRVKGTLQSDGSTLYAPAIPLAGSFNMLVLIQQASGEFGLLTNGRLARPVQSLYYFSNADLGQAKTAPVLSQPISPQVSGYAYEQGELSASGADIELCYYTGTTQKFETVPGNGFVNENDRLVVGREFDYTFQPSDNVTTAQFVLKDQTGNTVRTFSTSGAAALDTVELNFDDASNTALIPLVTLPGAAATDALLYSLEVTGNGGYSKTISLIFYDVASDLLSTWGIVQLQVSVPNAAMSLLDGNGNLYTPVLAAPDKTTSPYPVFEIRCKSRYTFWRYTSDDPTKQLNAPTSSIAAFLTGGPGSLTTIYPVPGTYLPYFFSQNPTATPPTFTYLPNPEPNTAVEVDGNQLFSNIWVPESGTFPVSAAPT
jgi:hypothetical protein